MQFDLISSGDYQSTIYYANISKERFGPNLLKMGSIGKSRTAAMIFTNFRVKIIHFVDGKYMWSPIFWLINSDWANPLPIFSDHSSKPSITISNSEGKFDIWIYSFEEWFLKGGMN